MVDSKSYILEMSVFNMPSKKPPHTPSRKSSSTPPKKPPHTKPVSRRRDYESDPEEMSRLKRRLLEKADRKGHKHTRGTWN